MSVKGFVLLLNGRRGLFVEAPVGERIVLSFVCTSDLHFADDFEDSGLDSKSPKFKKQEDLRGTRLGLVKEPSDASSLEIVSTRSDSVSVRCKRGLREETPREVAGEGSGLALLSGCVQLAFPEW